ncbi:MAG: anaerobic ribonucleoside-triphosphate reductase [Clostridia bacterium]|nr:anaerobic ribonucleoside-triphosphate reductase [Clostridia bacterium]
MTVTVQGGELSQREVQAYIDHIQEKNHQKVDDLTITVDGDYVDLNYTLAPVPFERIRRITGYLVGTMDRWNDAKKAEERDRVKHNV